MGTRLRRLDEQLLACWERIRAADAQRLQKAVDAGLSGLDAEVFALMQSRDEPAHPSSTHIPHEPEEHEAFDPLEHLTRVFNLDEIETDILLLCYAGARHERYSRIFALLHDRAEYAYPTTVMCARA